MLVGIALVAPRGLAASCSPILSADQVYSIARGAGFPADTAVKMVAIAMRESSLCPNAHNPGTLGVAEDSYGLWQINATGNPGLLSSMGITPTQLLDPNINAAAAYRMWGGSDANLNAAWAINKSGPPYYYAEKYQANLPAAQAAAARVEPAGSGDNPTFTVDVTSTPLDNTTPASSASLASLFGGTVSLFGYDVPIAGLAMGGLAVGLLLVLALGSSRRR